MNLLHREKMDKKITVPFNVSGFRVPEQTLISD
jgi:hypothetical protein